MPTQTIFDTSNIVRSLPYKAVSATVDKSFPGVTVDGKKYIKAGTLVAGNGGFLTTAQKLSWKTKLHLKESFYMM